MKQEPLELPELNANRIDYNAREISFNRKLVIVVAILLVALQAWSTIETKHSMEECENRLYFKLTGQENPLYMKEK